MKSGVEMRPERYHDVILIQDIAEKGLCAGDAATLVDYVPHPKNGEEGTVLERFNALGESIAVITVPVSAITSLSTDQVPTVRPLEPVA